MKIVERICLSCREMFLGKENEFICPACVKEEPVCITKEEIKISQFEADLNEDN